MTSLASASKNTGTYQSSDGLELFYRDFHSSTGGTPLLCLPGLTRNSRDFLDFATYIGKRRRVIAPDFRGRGFSEYDDNWRNYHPLTYVDDIWRLLDSLNVEQVIVVGTSMGGLCAMGMAAMYPARLRAVVMNDIGPEIDPAGIARIQSSVGMLAPVETWQEAIEQTRERFATAFPDISDAGWEKFARQAFREDSNGVPRIDYDSNIGRAAREGNPNNDEAWTYFDALSPLPTTLLWGVKSDILTRSIVEKMQARKTDLEVIPVAGRAHAPLLDEPECLAVIESLLSQHQ